MIVKALVVSKLFIAHLGRMIVGYGLITSVHLDGYSVSVVTGTDLLVREPDKQNSFRMMVSEVIRNDIRNDIWNG